jgi:hypothetical protein
MIPTMPMPIKKLAETERPLADRIEEFLRRDTEQAYSFSEIVVGVDGLDSAWAPVLSAISLDIPTSSLLALPSFPRHREALNDLVRQEKVRTWEHEGEKYFSALK